MNTAIQLYDPEVQRLAQLEKYNAHDHISQWTAFNKRTNLSEIVNYYPANWRLYELHLKYPEAKFDIDLILLDQETDFVIVRARLYIGDTKPRQSISDSGVQYSLQKNEPFRYALTCANKLT